MFCLDYVTKVQGLSQRALTVSQFGITIPQIQKIIASLQGFLKKSGTNFTIMSQVNPYPSRTSTLACFHFGVMAFLIFTLILPGCRPDDTDEPKDKESECTNSAHEGFKTLEQDGETREYILHVPASYNSNTATPLLINFHGFGGCAADFATDIGDFHELNAVADTANFLVVYPQGVTRQKGDAEWDPGDNGSQNINENDVYFVSQLIAEISQAYNVDAKRIYATGYSNGGMMAYGLACTQAEQIAAVGIMSGIMLPGTCDSDEYTSVIHFHGIDDGVLPFDGNQDFQSVPDVIDFWLNHNNIPASNLVTSELNSGDVVRDVYEGGNENTAVVLYTINREFENEGGHVWFSDDMDGKSPNEILWEFLSGFSL